MKPETTFIEWYEELISLSMQAAKPYLIGKPHMHWDSWADNWSAYREWNRLIKDEKGGPACYVCISRDISKRKAMEKELKDRVTELEKFYETAVSREVKMKDLKEEIEKLKKQN